MCLRIIKPISFFACVALARCQGWGNFWDVPGETAPKITAVTPPSGIVGDTITISGQRFASLASGNTVKFSGTLATVTAASATTLTVLVPPGAHSGSLTVTTADGSGSADFAVLKYFVYVTTSFSSAISVFSIDFSSGALSEISGSPFATAAISQGLAIHPSGKFIYVTLTSNVVVAYSVNTSGSLTSLGGSLPTGTGPVIAEVEPAGKFLYVVNTNAVSNNISGYAIGANGALTSLGNTPATGTNPSSITIDKAGNFLYVPNNNAATSTISCFAINKASGALGNCGTFAAGTNPWDATLSPSGRFLYATNAGGNSISGFTVDNVTGALTGGLPASPYATGTSPHGIRVHPSEKFLYAANFNGSSVSAFSLDTANGSLTFVGNYSTITTPESLMIEPHGKFLYATNNGGSCNQVNVYSINQQTGALTSLPTAVTQNNPYAIAIMGVPQ